MVKIYLTNKKLKYRSKNSPKQSLETIKEWLAWVKNTKGKTNVTPYGK